MGDEGYLPPPVIERVDYNITDDGVNLFFDIYAYFSDLKDINISYSCDQGETWESLPVSYSVVADPYGTYYLANATLPLYAICSSGELWLKIFVQLTDGEHNSSTLVIYRNVVFQLLPAAYSFTYELKQGWNLISIPFNQNYTLSEVFGDLAVYAFTWNSTTKSYQPVSVLEPFKGYWVYVPKDVNITIYSNDIIMKYTTTLEPGWHLIGTVYLDPSWGGSVQVNVTSGALYPGAFWWNPSTGDYVEKPLDQLASGKAYWLLAYKEYTEISVGPRPPSK